MDHRRITHVAALSALLLAAPGALLLAAPEARAQSESEMGDRRILLEQAEQASTGGDHARALDLASRAGRIRMTPSVRMFIAVEQAALGQSAPALGNAELCVQEAERDTAAASRQTILDTCRELQTRLRTQVGSVVVRVPASRPPGLQVRIGERPLNEALFDVPTMVTPGAVVVEATAPGFVTFRREVTVTAGQSVDVTLALAAAPTASVAPPGSTASVAPPGSTARVALPEPPDSRVAPRPVVDDSSNARRIGGIVGIAAGALLAGAGALSFVVRVGTEGDIARLCPGMAQACNRARAESNIELTLGLVGTIAGGLSLVFGIVLVATAGGGVAQPAPAPRPAAGHAAAGFGCGLGPGDVGVACGGAF